MTVSLNPEIPILDKDSVLYAIYRKLYKSFFDSQDKKSTSNPNGITEGDQISIRLHNTAYNFAVVMCEAASIGGGGSGGDSFGYLKKNGDSMSGLFEAVYGFKAGVNNSEVLNISQRNINDIVYGILSVTGKIEIESDGLLIDGLNALSYSKSNKTLVLNGDVVKIDSVLKVGGDKGLLVSPSSFKYNEKDVYHGANSNMASVDWAMNNSAVSGNLVVSKDTYLNGNVSTEGVVSMKFNGAEVLGVSNGSVKVTGWLNLSNGIQVKDLAVLTNTNKDIYIGSIGGNFILGNSITAKILLNAPLWDYNGSHVILDKFGSATFQNGLLAKHNFGNVVIYTYRVDDKDEGVVFPKKLKFDTQNGVSLAGKGKVFSIDMPMSSTLYYSTTIQPIASTSYFRPLDRESCSVLFGTEADFFTFQKPVESKDYLGIDGSSTRLTYNSLFFKENSGLLSTTEGIKHYGNSYFLGSLSSETFASGFSGYGWAIINNETTGNYVATFDELNVRKKMRVYELEVQKITATNGSLWVSDSCSGDTVEKL